MSCDALTNLNTTITEFLLTTRSLINQANKLDEIYAYGLRNPWKISFDSEDTLYAAGVGQNHIEEINIIKKGGHYG